MKRWALPNAVILLSLVALLSTCDKDKTVTQPEQPPPTTLASNGKLEPLPNPLVGGPGRSPAPGPGAPAPPSPTPSPSPSPSTTPTPTPSPTTTPCATPTMSFTASGTPHTTSSTGGAGDGPSVKVSGLDNCTIKAVRVKTQVTATSLSASTASAHMVIRLDRLGGPLGFELVNLGTTTKAPLVGSTMGTAACTGAGLVFAETGPPFSTASAPYNGTFSPYGQEPNPDGTFKPYKGTGANGTYNLYAAFLDDSITFQCFVLELDLQ